MEGSKKGEKERNTELSMEGKNEMKESYGDLLGIFETTSVA